MILVQDTNVLLTIFLSRDFSPAWGRRIWAHPQHGVCLDQSPKLVFLQVGLSLQGMRTSCRTVMILVQDTNVLLTIFLSWDFSPAWGRRIWAHPQQGACLDISLKLVFLQVGLSLQRMRTSCRTVMILVQDTNVLLTIFLSRDFSPAWGRRIWAHPQHGVCLDQSPKLVFLQVGLSLQRMRP